MNDEQQKVILLDPVVLYIINQHIEAQKANHSKEYDNDDLEVRQNEYSLQGNICFDKLNELVGSDHAIFLISDVVKLKSIISLADGTDQSSNAFERWSNIIDELKSEGYNIQSVETYEEGALKDILNYYIPILFWKLRSLNSNEALDGEEIYQYACALKYKVSHLFLDEDFANRLEKIQEQFLPSLVGDDGISDLKFLPKIVKC